jgi:hypothetical protein
MMKIIGNNPIAYRVGGTLLIILISCQAFWESFQIIGEVRKWSEPFSLVLGLTVFLVNVMGLYWVAFGLANLWDHNWKRTLTTLITRLRETPGWFRWPIAIIGTLSPVFIILYTSLGIRLTGVGFRLALFIVITGFIAVLVNRRKDTPVSWDSLLISILLLGSVFALAKAFIGVVDHPLSLTWSEGNRIWDYSILFGRDLYHYPDNLPFKVYIDRGRQTLWGLPFLLPNVSITGVRLWSAILFTLPYALLGWMAFQPNRQSRNQWVWFGLWSFLFINQGPIYTPLILIAILIVGTRKKPIWLALPLIFLAGYYALESRITWMIAPALWGGLIALLHSPFNIDLRKSRKQWGRIIANTLAGALGGFGINQGWRRIQKYFESATRKLDGLDPSGLQQSVSTNIVDKAEVLGSAVSNTALIDQPLLWERLLPNPTYGAGIILGLMLAVGPVLLLLFYLIRTNRWKINLWQRVGLIGVFGSLLAVGLVVSIKIGGGGDLHNLDMFIVSITIASAIAWENAGYNFFSNPENYPVSIKILLLLVIFIPAFTPWIDAKPLELPPEERTLWTMELLRSETSRVLGEGKDILFMDQRQLLTFKNLGNIPLIPEYEKKLVMDRAMSGNSKYFETFNKDIANHRFGLIISDPQRIRFSEADEEWGVENDVWVEWVTKPLLCHYEPVYTIKATGVWLLIPRLNSAECSFPTE